MTVSRMHLASSGRSIDKDIATSNARCWLSRYWVDMLFPIRWMHAFLSTCQARLRRSRIVTGLSIGFSLYERPLTLRGMENLMTDFTTIRILSATCCEPSPITTSPRSTGHWNGISTRSISVTTGASSTGADGPRIWHEFIYPEVKRTYAAVHQAGKAVLIHSCGDVQELFDDLIDIASIVLIRFNPRSWTLPQ